VQKRLKHEWVPPWSPYKVKKRKNRVWGRRSWLLPPSRPKFSWLHHHRSKYLQKCHSGQ